MGGAGLVAGNISAGMRELGFDSSVLVSTDGNLRTNPFRNPLLTIAAALDHFIVKKPDFVGQFSLFRSNLTGSVKLRTNLRSTILNLHWFAGVISLNQILELYPNQTVVVTLHDMWLLTGGCHQPGNCSGHESSCTSCPNVRKPFIPLVRKSASLKDGVIKHKGIGIVSPSRWMVEASPKIKGSLGENVRIIHNPIDDEFFNQADTKAFNNSKVEKQAITIAADLEDPNKQILKMCQDFERATENNLDSSAKLILVGGNGARFANNFKHVEWAGNLSQDALIPLLDSSAFNIGYSIAENYPSVVIESAARGLPTLALRNSGYTEVIEDLGGGQTFEFTSELWSHFFEANETDALHIAEKKRVFLKAKSYSREAIAKQYLHFYEELEIQGRKKID